VWLVLREIPDRLVLLARLVRLEIPAQLDRLDRLVQLDQKDLEVLSAKLEQ
jgi:hypothetical protein